MARRPKEEESLPFIRLEFHGDNYGYVNWLHIVSKPEELSPQGYGLIGMHSNCGITFDLHAIRAQHPNKKMVRFRSSVGNLESKLESYVADAWVLIDGQLRYRRKEFSREDGADVIELPLADRDRFLVLVVTDAGAKTAYDWIAFGDPVIEMTNREGFTGAAFLHQRSQTSEDDESTHSLPQREASTDRGRGAVAESTIALLGDMNSSLSDAWIIVERLVAAGSHYSISSLALRSPEKAGDSRCQSESGRISLTP